MLLKDKCMCLQEEWKFQVTGPAGQVQYWNIFVPLYMLCIWHYIKAQILCPYTDKYAITKYRAPDKSV